MLNGAASAAPGRWTSGPAVGPRTGPSPTRCPRTTWVEPIPDDRVLPDGRRPGRRRGRRASRSGWRSSPRCSTCRRKQRAVLILREVLRWRADEVAELLDTTRRLGQQRPPAGPGHARRRGRSATATRSTPLDDEQQALLARYVDAFERYDMDALTALLHEDATWSMPPYDLWLQTHEDIVEWCLGPGIGCKGSRLIPTMANGSPAFGQYKPAPTAAASTPWSLQVVEISRRSDQRDHLLPRHRPPSSRSSACRLTSTAKAAPSPRPKSVRPALVRPGHPAGMPTA